MKKNAEQRNDLYLTDAQLQSEFAKCEFCEEKPCREKCPADCSAADFIMAARVFAASDIRRAAAQIMKNNPFGGVCGLVCPDKFCMAACVHKKLDSAVNIPAVQATIVKKARELGGIAEFAKARPNGKKVAVVGSGPAGIGAAAVLAQLGCRVDIFEKGAAAGGTCNLIPEYRLEKRDAAPGPGVRRLPWRNHHPAQVRGARPATPAAEGIRRCPGGDGPDGAHRPRYAQRGSCRRRPRVPEKREKVQAEGPGGGDRRRRRRRRLRHDGEAQRRRRGGDDRPGSDRRDAPHAERDE